MRTLFADVRYAFRLIRKNPAFSMAAVAALALGIGANTAVFSVLYEVLLRPLPYPQQERLVILHETNLRLGVEHANPSTANYIDWAAQNHVFERMAGWRFVYFNLSGGAQQPERIQGLRVSADFFPLLGTRLALGRHFLPEEEQAGRDRVAVLSYGLWRRRFGGNAGIIGSRIAVDGEQVTIAGILPRDFQIFRVLNRELDLYMPLALHRSQISREDHSLNVYAALKAGVLPAQAQSELDTIARRLEYAYPATNAGWGVKLTLLRDAFALRSRAIVLLLPLASGFTLLIACANIANLLLARAAARRKEMAIRMAAGAGRLQLIRQLLGEGLALALPGAAAGALVAVWAIDIINHCVSFQAIARLHDFRVDGRVLCFTLGLAIVTGVLFSLAPAWQTTKVNLSGALKDGIPNGASGPARRSTQRLIDVCAVLEIALAMILLTGAAATLKASQRLLRMDRGFDATNVLTMQIWLPEAKYARPGQVAQFFQQVMLRVRGLAGVEAVSVVNYPPGGSLATSVGFDVPGRAQESRSEALTARYWVISPDYFKVTRIRLLEGRQFSELDRDTGQGAVIISEHMAREFWPAQSAVGRIVRPRFPKSNAFWQPYSENLPLKVAGVARDVKEDGIVNAPLPQMYLPYAQNPSKIMHLLVRTSGNPMLWAAAVRNEVTAVDPDQPVFDVKPMGDVAVETFSQRRVTGVLLGIFAAVSLVLAALGVYSVLAYAVAQQRREIGIRIALGAERPDVIKMLLARTMRLAITGVAAGFAGALVMLPAVASRFPGIGAGGMATFFEVSAVLPVVALAASYFPVRKATKVDPAVALRCE